MNSNIKDGYKLVLTNYANQKKYIPPNHLVEINFEDLIAKPEQIIFSIYNQLGLGSPDVEKLKDVLHGIKEYKQQEYSKKIDMDCIDREMVDLYRHIKPDQNKDK